jgi:serine/threonine-protein kinase
LFAAAVGLGVYLGNLEPERPGKKGAATTAAPKTVVTARVVEMTAQQAQLELQKQEFTVAAIEERYDEVVPQGHVIAQDPEPGEPVQLPATAKLVVSKGKERVAVPAIQGKTRAEAETALATANLRAEVTEAFHETIAKGIVISVEKTPAEGMKPQSPVTLVVSKGRQPIQVPVVKGKTTALATKAITEAGLKAVPSEDFSRTVKKGLVISQTPATGPLYKNDVVKIVVSKGPPLVTVPNVKGMRRVAAFNKLKSLGFDVHFIDYPGQKGKTVQTQFPAAGTKKLLGSTVSLYML